MNLLKYQSKIKRKCIYKTSNDIYVYQYGDYRWILFNDLYIQTMINIKKPKKTLLPYLAPLLTFTRLQPGPICLLGLGGGGAIHALHDSKIELTAVEKYPEMIKIAQQFFYIQEHEKVKIICESADIFLQKNTKKFDHLIIDLGDHFGFPSECRNSDFFENSYHAIAENGILALNLTQHADIADFKNIITQVFGHKPLILQAAGNWLLIIKKNPHGRNELIELMQHHHLIKNFIWDMGFGESIILTCQIEQHLRRWQHKLFKWML